MEIGAVAWALRWFFSCFAGNARASNRDDSKEPPMQKQGDVHVMPGEKAWRVEVEGSDRPRSTLKSQSEAAKAARTIARSNKSELLIHRRNGRARDRSTYGHDPHRTKG
jgi:hypothetical protein